MKYFIHIMALLFIMESRNGIVNKLKDQAASAVGMGDKKKPEEEVDPVKEAERLQNESENSFSIQMNSFNQNLGNLTSID